MVDSQKKLFLVLSVLLLTTTGVVIQYLYGFSWIDTSGHAFGSDDAYITYRYAHNFLSGCGLTFNCMGEKVEGYSNFLYLVSIIPGFVFGHGNIYIYSVCLNIGLLFLVLYLFYKILIKYVSFYYAILGLALLGLNPVVWANVTTGLETIMVLAGFTGLWLVLESKRNKINFIAIFVISSLAMLTRVDGFILPIIASIYLLLNNERKLGLELLAFTGIFMAVYAFARFVYYDDVIANTYYAKVSGSIFLRVISGIRYLENQTLYNGLAVYSLLAFLFIIKERKKFHVLSFPLIFSALWVVYLIYIGGDIYYERFLLPILIVGIFYFVLLLKDLYPAFRYITLLLVFVSSFSIFFHDGRFHYQQKNYDMWVMLGKLFEQVPNNYMLAIDAAGKVPYFSGLKTIDMLGLNNKTIGKMHSESKSFIVGHNKHDPDYVLASSPNIIAAWLVNYKDMSWGLTSTKYSKKYKLKYLVNSTRKKRINNIYDVEKLDNYLIQYLIGKGYNYGVLVRKDSLKELSLMVNDFGAPVLEWQGYELPSQIGVIKKEARVSSDKGAGYLTFGPYIQLPEGDYRFEISYKSSKPRATIVGNWDVAVSIDGKVERICAGDLLGTDGQISYIIKEFVVSSKVANHKFEIRSYHNGLGKLEVDKLTVKKVALGFN